MDDIGGINMMRQRRISAMVGGQIFAAAASSKHVVYLVSSEHFFPTDALGRQDAERTLQEYHKDFGTSVAVSNYVMDGVKYQNWTVPGGPKILIELHCSDKAVVVEILDYSRKAADDGEDSLRFIRMGPSPDPFCF